jgi:polyisoprenoid-binding protein YceI
MLPFIGTVWRVTDTDWSLDASDGELLVRTGVTGRAAKIGHRLTITMNSWRAAVRWTEGRPVAAELTVDVDSLQVSHGEGGLMALSGPEKALARSHALKSLGVSRFPRIRFRADDIEQTDDGYRLSGTLEIHGTSRSRVVDLCVEDLGGSWRMSCEADVGQTEFGVRPYSMLMGAMKVVDTVTVAFTAMHGAGPG